MTVPRRGLGFACAVALAAMMASGGPSRAATTARSARVGSAAGSQRLSLVFPLRANEAALERFALAVSTPGSPQYRSYQPIAQLSRRFGASARTRRLVLAYLRAAGAEHIAIDATGLFADATLTAARAEQLFATPLARFRAGRYSFIAPTATVVVPRALRGLVGGVIGLDTRPLLAPAAPSRAVADTEAAAHAGLQPQSGYFPATGTPNGCTAGERDGRVHARPVPHGVRLRTAAQRRDHGPGRACRADRDRWLPQGRHRGVRSLLRSALGADQRVRRRRQQAARAWRRGDPRHRGARRGGSGSEVDRRLRDAFRSGSYAQGAHRAPAERRLQAAGDLGIAGPVRAVHVRRRSAARGSSPPRGRWRRRPRAGSPSWPPAATRARRTASTAPAYRSISCR